MAATLVADATAALAGSGEASEVFHHPSFENEHGEATPNWKPIRNDGAFELQRSTLVVDGLDVSALNENYIKDAESWRRELLAREPGRHPVVRADVRFP
jgi:hypothetical protein